MSLFWYHILKRLSVTDQLKIPDKIMASPLPNTATTMFCVEIPVLNVVLLLTQLKVSVEMDFFFQSTLEERNTFPDCFVPKFVGFSSRKSFKCGNFKIGGIWVKVHHSLHSLELHVFSTVPVLHEDRSCLWRLWGRGFSPSRL